jgi:phosphoribosylformylglycinamidine synthase subunit PurL
LTEESKQDRPAVQVGDPFKGKLLLEACLELLASGCVAGIQDMGAAGLTCSTCETASRGGTGVEIDLALVPQREPGMTPYEILLSESQERMLIIVERGREATVKEIFDKWDLPYACVGKVTDDGVMRVLNRGRVEVEIPAEKLANDAPVYEREVVAGPSVPEVRIEDIPPADLHESLMRLLAHPTIASKNWVYRQYDHTVRAGTVVPPGSDAAVFYVREADKYLAATTDCNGLYCKLNPREGARIAVAEAARNLVCSGAKPLAVTDNLNFGNPYHPANFWQLCEAVEGLAEACRRFDTPVTGGNVSLYNQNPNGAIDPTPTVGMVGVIDQERWITRQYFRDASDVIYLIGPIGHELGASQYLTIIHGRREFLPPRLSYDLELGVQAVVLALIQQGLVKSAHDCSEGGFGVAIAECCISGERRIGAAVDFGHWPERLDQILFNESQSRVIISVGAEDVDAMETVCAAAEIPFGRVGEVGGSELIISTRRETLQWDVAELYQAWYASIERAMSSQ